MFNGFERVSKLAKAVRGAKFGGPQFQSLESRTHMTAVPLSVTTMGTALGTELRITGTPGNDTITLKQSGSTLNISTSTGWTQSFNGIYADVRIDGGAGNDLITINKTVSDNVIVLGGDGNDQIIDGGSGTDSLYGGAGVNKITAGSGNDTLVTIGGSADTLTGGGGLDSFWGNTAGDVYNNVTAAETNAGAVHKIASFMSLTVNTTTQTPTKVLAGQTFAEPTLASYATGYTDFSSKPLFSAVGPSENDIEQGGIGDCYYLSTLSSIAKLNPQVIRQSIVSLGDGTYAVQFTNSSGVKQYLRIDGKLPTTSWGGLAYAGTGAQSSTWVALMEKAWTYFRSGVGSYNSIDAGYMGEAYNALGLANHSIYSAANPTALLQTLAAELAAGHSVTYATANDMANLIGGHAYTVDHVMKDAKGNITAIVVRNPWGVDGAGEDGKDDGYVTVTPTVAFQDFSFATAGNSAWPATATVKKVKKTKKAKKTKEEITPAPKPAPQPAPNPNPAVFSVKPVR